MLTASPLGRQVLFSWLGISIYQLFEMLGLGSVPGTAPLVALGEPYEPTRATRNWQDVAALEIRRLLAGLVATHGWKEEIAETTDIVLLRYLANVTYGFGFGPDDEALWVLTALAADELEPVAETLIASDAASRWWNEVDRGDQRLLQWNTEAAFMGADLRGVVHDAMVAARADNHVRLEHKVSEAERARDRAKNIRHGAWWWSAPYFDVNCWSVGPVGGMPTVELFDFVDGSRESRADGAIVWRVEIDPAARVFEVMRPADWQELVARFPTDVTGTHDGEWRDWGGVAGPWRLPDWERVMEQYDAVHVSVGGYVSSCGLALEVDNGYTMLAGWVPDSTLWLADMAVSANRLGTWSGDTPVQRTGLNGTFDLEGWHPFTEQSNSLSDDR